MSVTYPEAFSSQGKRKIMILTAAPADPAAPSLATDFGGGTEATYYMLGTFAPGGSQNKGNSPRRAGESNVLQVLGNANNESPTLTYLHDPTTSGGTANAVKDLLPEGTECWIYSMPVQGDADTAFAAGDVLRLDHVTVGAQFEMPSGDDEFAVEQVTQETGYVTRPITATLAA